MIRRPAGSVALALGSLAALSACGRVVYSPPATTAPVVEATSVVRAPFERTWNAVVQTLFEKNIPIRTIEKASGILETDELRGEVGRECDCGTYLGIPVAGYGTYGGDAHYRFRVLVEKRSEDETAITLRSSCRATNERIGELNCRLQAAKESEVRDAIAARARSAGKSGGSPR